MYYVNYFRRWLIRKLIGKMEVCMNMKVVGEVSYSGTHGGAIVENNLFAGHWGEFVE